MKELITLLCVVILSLTATVSADIGDSKQEEKSTTERTLKTDKGIFIEPTYMFGSVMPFFGVIEKLAWESKRELKLVKATSGSIPMSKFQLIVDKEANVLDVTMLESTNLPEDKTVLKYLQNEFLFVSPATLDGKPCNALVIFSLRYGEPGPENMKLESYPLIAPAE